MTVSPYDLTTISEARSWGNIPPATPDATIQRLITAWSQIFMTQTLRGMDLIAGQSTVEQRDGTGTDSILTYHYPVIAPLTQLMIGLSVVPVAVYPAFGYVLDPLSGLITLTPGGYPFTTGGWGGGKFTKGRGNVLISYNYGYASIPTDVSEAANAMVLWLLRQRDHVDLDTATLAGQITKYKSKFPIDVQLTMDYYTRKRRRP